MHNLSCANHCLLDSLVENHAYAMKTNILLTLAFAICFHAEGGPTKRPIAGGRLPLPHIRFPGKKFAPPSQDPDYGPAAIQCFECSGATCNDHFDKSGQILLDNCTQCKKTKGNFHGVNGVTRSCLTSNAGSNGCRKIELYGLEMTECLCSTDGCNGGSSVYVTMATVLLPLLVFANHVF
ncbi:uncharacterized protein LOC127846990 [Dreissena polymorpha]|uniref:Protein sleepless n=1 Tax=Dreissena polymorpha TaxID=45954 RepID=A0A9D4DL09_DREPO|nr:uncharacterized protein LOC127846990 [Dreissena polymorpha]KAH3750706.1 hypothetical protein DPMN_185237 [Dreissena polymorpha]